MVVIVSVFAPIVLAVLAGVGLRLLKIADDSWVAVFNEYGLFIGFPALIFLEISRVEPAAVLELLPMLGLNAALLVTIFIGTHLVLSLFPMSLAVRNAFALMAFFGNVAYIGYPVVTRAFAGAGGTVSLVMATYSLTMFTLGIGSLEIAKAGRIRPWLIARRIATNPFIIAIALGLLCSTVRIPVPAVLRSALQMLGGAATPMVLMAVGVFLVRPLPVGGLLGKVGALAAVRLGLVPALAYLIVRVLFAELIPPQPGSIQILEAAMPVGITTFALGTRYPVDQTFAVAGIFVTTVLSAITLPIWLGILI